MFKITMTNYNYLLRLIILYYYGNEIFLHTEYGLMHYFIQNKLYLINAIEIYD